MDRNALASELSRLQNATPTSIESFAVRRAARITEIEGLLASMQAPEVVEKDEKLDSLLARIQGGDKFGR